MSDDRSNSGTLWFIIAVLIIGGILNTMRDWKERNEWQAQIQQLTTRIERLEAR